MRPQHWPDWPPPGSGADPAGGRAWRTSAHPSRCGAGTSHTVSLSPSTLQTLTDCPLRWMAERHGGTGARALNSTLGSLVHALLAVPGKTEDQLVAELENLWKWAALPFAAPGMPPMSSSATAR